MMSSALEISNLTKHYEHFTLDRVSFCIPGGTVMGLIGENGAGKSTTIHSILDLIHRDAGSISFWGKELSDDPMKIKEDIGVVFDSMNFHETLTPVKAGKIMAAAYRQWDDALYLRYLEQFQLPAKQEIKTLSKGMKTKLCIAAALSHHPRLLILDEPTSGLDPVMREEILDIFFNFIQDDSHSILMSSHISADLLKIADYITFLHQGKVVFSKSKDDVIDRYGLLKCNTALFEQLNKADILSYRKCDMHWEVLVSDKEMIRRTYRAAAVDDITIDDILLLYVKGERPL